MASAEMIRGARHRSGLSLAALAVRVGIPNSEMAAYETGTKTPDPEILDWILTCAALDRGEELEALLELAEQFPARYRSTLEYPVFGR